MSREPSGVGMSDTLGRTRRVRFWQARDGRHLLGDGLGQCKTLWDSAKLLFFKPTSYEGYRSETDA